MNILWIPHAPWRTPQRARFFAEALARTHRVHVTNWDGDFTRPADLLSRRYLTNVRAARWEDGPVTVHHVPRVSPAVFSRRLRDLNTRWFGQHLERIIAQEQIDVVVGTFVAPVPVGVPLVTDIFDDNVAHWETYGTGRAYGQEIAASETAWIGASRAVTAVSSVVAAQVRGRFPEQAVTHVPNAVDLARYVPDRQRARLALGLRADIRYVGTIGALDRREEADRLLAVAERLRGERGVELLVVGRGAARPYLERQLARRRLTGVRCVGFVTGDPLLRYFQSLDVGLCPYRATPADHARTPLRLLHYSAVGAAVVCTRLEEVERMAFGNVILTDDDDDAFAAGVLRALERGGAVPAGIAPYDQHAVSARLEAILRGAAGGHAA